MTSDPSTSGWRHKTFSVFRDVVLPAILSLSLTVAFVIVAKYHPTRLNDAVVVLSIAVMVAWIGNYLLLARQYLNAKKAVWDLEDERRELKRKLAKATASLGAQESTLPRVKERLP